MKLPITAVIPVKNESDEIDSLVKNLSFLDEVLFVDNGSTDDTVEKIRKCGARVIVYTGDSFSKIRQFGDDNASHDWVLSMDADMRVTPSLRKEIEKSTQQTLFDSYRIGRRNIIFGKEMKHTDWSPRDDFHIRLYNKATGSWKSIVHELWECDGNVGIINCTFLHYNYKDVEEYWKKIDSYSSLAVRKLKIDKTKLVSQIFAWSIKDFFKRYIYKLGFLDGYHGLMLSYLQAIYYICLGVKIYETRK